MVVNFKPDDNYKVDGVTTIPRTYDGESLAYISPEEALRLRERGGGVPPNDPSGQITKFGIPSFQNGAPNWLTSGAYRKPSSPYYQPPAPVAPAAPVAPSIVPGSARPIVGPDGQPLDAYGQPLTGQAAFDALNFQPEFEDPDPGPPQYISMPPPPPDWLPDPNLPDYKQMQG